MVDKEGRVVFVIRVDKNLTFKYSTKYAGNNELHKSQELKFVLYNTTLIFLVLVSREF